MCGVCVPCAVCVCGSAEREGERRGGSGGRGEGRVCVRCAVCSVRCVCVCVRCACVRVCVSAVCACMCVVVCVVVCACCALVVVCCVFGVFGVCGV